MHIIADENIPAVRAAFADLGPVTTLPGRSLSPRDVRDADVLLVRSVTRVDTTLLRESRVRFVASATIGVDHLDLDYLEAAGIGCANAPACNAVSAAEYVVSALVVLAQRQGFRLDGKTVGIVGHGNVGSRVRQRLEALGATCLVNDPPQQHTNPIGDYVSLAEIREADIITLHVPLTHAGAHPTFHLVSAPFLQALRPGTILINTSRGAVISNEALGHQLQAGADLTVVLDVWEGEPEIDLGLLQQVEIATPHIAGYSLDGKLRGTEMIYRAVCSHFGIEPGWSAEDALPAPPEPLRMESQDAFTTIRNAVLACYDVRRDDAALRAVCNRPLAERGRFFDALRSDYPPRREFGSLEVVLPGGNNRLADQLNALGFHTIRRSG